MIRGLQAREGTFLPQEDGLGKGALSWAVTLQRSWAVGSRGGDQRATRGPRTRQVAMDNRMGWGRQRLTVHGHPPWMTVPWGGFEKRKQDVCWVHVPGLEGLGAGQEMLGDVLRVVTGVTEAVGRKRFSIPGHGSSESSLLTF